MSSSEVDRSLAELQAMEAERQKAQEIAKDLEGKNIKPEEIQATAAEQAKELTDVLGELNKMSEDELKKTGTEG